MEGYSESRVLDIRNISPFVRQFTLTYSQSHLFVPGQFVILNLPIHSEFSTRSYSIASAPNNEGWIELCIVHKPDGAGTDYLFASIKPGDSLWVSEPQGKFVLDREQKGSICLVCTGTGVAPFRSMIQEMLREGESLDRPVYLVFGNRYAQDILYREEWETLAAEDPRFHFLPVLSREESWNGPRGYVHEHYLPLAKGDSSMCFYLCGWTQMVREAKNRLKELGFPRKQLKFELYD